MTVLPAAPPSISMGSGQVRTANRSACAASTRSLDARSAGLLVHASSANWLRKAGVTMIEFVGTPARPRLFGNSGTTPQRCRPILLLVISCERNTSRAKPKQTHWVCPGHSTDEKIARSDQVAAMPRVKGQRRSLAEEKWAGNRRVSDTRFGQFKAHIYRRKNRSEILLRGRSSRRGWD